MLRTNKQNASRAVGSSAHYIASRVVNMLKEDKKASFDFNNKFVQVVRKDNKVVVLSNYSKEAKSFSVAKIVADSSLFYKEIKETVNDFTYAGVHAYVVVEGTFTNNLK